MPHPKQDLAWKHCEMIKDGKRVYVKCKFCSKMFKGGGIFRFKEHLAGRKGGGPMCQSVPPDVRLLMEQLLDGNVERNSLTPKVDVRATYNAVFSDSALACTPLGISEDGISGKRRKKDSAWEHCQSIGNGGPRVQIKCNYCGKLFKGGGIFRFKEHLAGRKGSAPVCVEVPSDVRELMLQNLSSISSEPRKRLKETRNECNVEDDGNHLYNGVAVVAKAAQTYNESNLNAMDDLEVVSTAELHGAEDERLANEVIGRKSLVYSVNNSVQLAIGRFLHEIGASTDALDSFNFHGLLDLIGSRCVVPYYTEVNGWILKKLVEETRKDVENFQAVWRKSGCSILVEEMALENGRILLNFMVRCYEGTVFLRSVDAANAMQSEDELHKTLKEVVEEVGPENVVQVITNCGDAYVAAGRRLMETFPSVYWAPCATQCVDMILEDICHVEWISSVIGQARSVTRFMYNSSSVLNLVKRFTAGNDIVQNGHTSAAATISILKRMVDLKVNLKTMVNSQEWVDSPYSEQLGGLALLDIVENETFWSSCSMIIRLTNHLVRVLDTVTAQNKPAMGYVFAGIYRAKEAIKKTLVKSEDYMVYWKIIDRRWEQLWRSPLHAAGFFLNPKFFYSTQGELYNDILSRVFDCIERMVPDAEVQDKIVKEINLYKNAAGDLGRKMAIRARDTLLPGEWWATYGGGCSNLTRMAVKVVSQPCSLIHSKQKIFAFSKLYETKNRLERQRLVDTVFVQYNLRLKRLKRASDVSIETAEEWLARSDLCVNEEETVDWMPLVASQAAASQFYEEMETGFEDLDVLCKCV